MKVITNEQIVCYDVDDTMILWGSDYTQPGPDKVAFIDPYDNSINYLRVHTKHINLLKKYKGRKNFIIVWSAAGAKWAESVVKTLNLQPYVDVVMTKPNKYVDDLPVEEWLTSRIYLK